MIFGRFALADARGGLLAHAVQIPSKTLRKGTLLDDEALAMLTAAGLKYLTIAKLEPGDVPEGEAATKLGNWLCIGPTGLASAAPIHGRVNLYATVTGVVRLDSARLLNLNLLDEAITLATLSDGAIVNTGDLVATLKIIPFAVPGDKLNMAKALLADVPVLQVKPFKPLMTGLILSRLPHVKDSVIDGTIAATRARIVARSGTLLDPIITPHDADPIATAINQLRNAGAELILICGASAVTDRLDIAPEAIRRAGGAITQFGMPVDPGNLICLGALGDTPVSVLPGCARSPALNGIDWVLDRIFANEAVDRAAIAAMGAGGLLKDATPRPIPRPKRPSAPRIAALVLAAGVGSRMRGQNKMLSALPSGQLMIKQTLLNITSSQASPIIVVTGHKAEATRAALEDSGVEIVFAPDYAEGMAASLRAGIKALPETADGVLICLGDMPLVSSDVLDTLIAKFDPVTQHEIIFPSFYGQRGNPVLWGRRFFSDLLSLSGDAGAKALLPRFGVFCLDVAVESDGVLRDFDTPEALASL